jgi:hypothetical protein
VSTPNADPSLDDRIDTAAQSAVYRLLLVQYREDLRAIWTDNRLSIREKERRVGLLRLRYRGLV